jgi:predicted glycosyltransferase involved in capsule biosynthesis
MVDFKEVSFLVPFKSDGSYREKNWEWLRRRYEILFPEAEICIGDADSKPYSRAKAINSAARKAKGSIFVIVDADILFNYSHIAISIMLLESYTWVIPYTKMYKLTEEQSNEILNKDFLIDISQKEFTGCECLPKHIAGGICVIPRKHFEAVYGFDEQFSGWGGEDDAFRLAVDVICGYHVRPSNSTLCHLYHTPQVIDPNNYNPNCNILYNCYNNYENIVNQINLHKSFRPDK